MQHVNIKLFAETPVDLAAAIPVFHRWIRDEVCPELLIDVADYRHVPDGPGVMLVGHQASYSLDSARGRLGLLYNRKAGIGDADGLGTAWEAVSAAARRLEREPEFAGSLRFPASEIELTLNDRLLYPNTEETWNALRGEIEAFFDSVYGAGAWTAERTAGPRERFRVSVRARP